MNTTTQLSVQQQLVSIRTQVEDIVAQLLSEHPLARYDLQKTVAIGHLIDSLPFASEFVPVV